MIEVWYDGACAPENPGGHAGSGILIKADSNIIHTDYRYIGYGPLMSNNVAEYDGLILAFTYLIENNLSNQRIVCYGDSKLTVKQMSGKWKAKSGLYIPYHIKAKILLRNFRDISFKWIPRESNSDADELSKTAIYKQIDAMPISPSNYGSGITDYVLG